jgi:hypothetical protein
MQSLLTGAYILQIIVTGSIRFTRLGADRSACPDEHDKITSHTIGTEGFRFSVFG